MNGPRRAHCSRRCHPAALVAAAFRLLTWGVAVSLLLATSATADPVDLLDLPPEAYHPLHCAVELTDDGIDVICDDSGSGGVLDVDISTLAIDGPVALHYKMRTEVRGDYGEYSVFWVGVGESAWRRFERPKVQPDGKWHDYRLALAPAGRLRALRFAFGKQPHTIGLADIQLVPISAGLTEFFRAKAQSMPRRSKLQRDDLAVEVDWKKRVFAIQDGRTGRIWRSQPVSNWLQPYQVRQNDDQTLVVEIYDRFAESSVVAEVTMLADHGVRFSITPENAESPIAGARGFPPQFRSDIQHGQFVFCDRSCGVLLDTRDPAYAGWPLRVYGNTHCLDMPWVGLFDHARGDGMMLLVDTPADAEVAFDAADDGRHWPQVHWLPSMDQIAYPRTATLRFSDQGGYVELAGKYRRYLESAGRLKTLRGKALEKPRVELLRGAPPMWGDHHLVDFIQSMRPLGLRRGIVNNCKDPARVAWLNDLGYLTGRYDSYTDFLEGAPSFQRDRVEHAAVHSRPGGAPKHGWKLRGGGQMFWRSSAVWQAAEESYVPGELARLPYTSRFIDVAAAAELLEDFHPEHRHDRRQDLVNRRGLFDRMNDRGLVVGTEHGNDWVADQVDYVEGSMSGPFWWSSWDAGYLDRPRREQLSPEYLKFGMGYAHRVPLWELVYHDCAVSTWYWGDTAGMLYEAAPELAERKDLYNLLYGTVPLIWMDGRGYRYPEQQHRMLQTVHDTCRFHEVVAFEAMTNHEFLSDDKALQRTTFSNGAVAIVNFSDVPRTIDVSGSDATLAPRGYHVHGPQFIQTKLWSRGAAEMVISKPGYLIIQSTGARPQSGVTCKGRATIFEVTPDRWNLFTDPSASFAIDVSEALGWSADASIELRRMGEKGEIGEAVARPDHDGIVRGQSTNESWRYMLLRAQGPARLPK